MARSVPTLFKSLRLILHLIVLCLVLSPTITWGQTDGGVPMTREHFISSINLGRSEKKSPATYIRLVEMYGVDFQMTRDDETRIRQAGSYLKEADLDNLIAAVRDNYRSYKGGRLRVTLFKYATCDQYHDQFAEFLSSKVIALPSSLISKDVRYSYVAGLRLVKEQKTFTMNLEDAIQYCEETLSLQLLRGTCSTNGNDVKVISQVFLGDPKGPLGSSIRIEFKIDPAAFADTRDIHTLLLLYSLAKDAQARGLSKDLIIKYLAEALGIADQIKHSDPATLQAIKNAIEGMLKGLGTSNLVTLPNQ